MKNIAIKFDSKQFLYHINHVMKNQTTKKTVYTKQEESIENLFSEIQSSESLNYLDEFFNEERIRSSISISDASAFLGYNIEL